MCAGNTNVAPEPAEKAEQSSQALANTIMDSMVILARRRKEYDGTREGLIGALAAGYMEQVEQFVNCAGYGDLLPQDEEDGQKAEEPQHDHEDGFKITNGALSETELESFSTRKLMDIATDTMIVLARRRAETYGAPWTLLDEFETATLGLRAALTGNDGETEEESPFKLYGDVPPEVVEFAESLIKGFEDAGFQVAGAEVRKVS